MFGVLPVSSFYILLSIAMAILNAASSRHGAKLGQSLKSIIFIEPSSPITQSPP